MIFENGKKRDRLQNKRLQTFESHLYYGLEPFQKWPSNNFVQRKDKDDWAFMLNLA